MKQRFPSVELVSTCWSLTCKFYCVIMCSFKGLCMNASTFLLYFHVVNCRSLVLWGSISWLVDRSVYHLLFRLLFSLVLRSVSAYPTHAVYGCLLYINANKFKFSNCCCDSWGMHHLIYPWWYVEWSVILCGLCH